MTSHPAITIHNSILNGQLLTSFKPWQIISYLLYFEHQGQHTLRHGGFSKIVSLKSLLTFLSHRKEEFLAFGCEIKNLGSVYRFKLPNICGICHKVGHIPSECVTSEVILSRRMLELEDIEFMVNSILEHKILIRKIVLRFNDLGGKGAKIIARLISRSDTIVELVLESTKIDDEGIELIADALGENRSIERIILNNNEFGSRGLTSMAKILKNNKTLRIVELSSRGNPEEATQEFLQIFNDVLITNTSITSFTFNARGLQNLSHNSISDNHNHNDNTIVDTTLLIKSKLFTNITRYLEQNRMFDSILSSAAIELMNKSRIFFLNIQGCDLSVRRIPFEIWAQMFRCFGEHSGLTTKQVDMIVKFSATRVTLSSTITKRDFLECVYFNKKFWVD
ncbi:7629_t:CDS:1 [Acaulospora morrowiae]|uniref:7629_t:CDS:1 n=1 Tax=Acaulospora morrowiae TaxID=94023 RepID=A0A9N9FY21_9GLOM|nr:7629_t:CDS:1 [Acaulospora morrowiae]